ncbi:MAG: SCP2 sterol-binding domain-containing protein, partial [Butyrivibrio sp.]|nr:SCP2 sterol-binding domain-containing protein [Butyrivibrio sp.]
MTYQDIVKKVQSAYKKADASSIADHVAIQVNVEGEGEGAFYVEVADKKVNVEPFEYFDRDALVFANAETIIAVAEGKLDCGKAYEEGKVRVEGDLGKAAVLSAIAPKA